MAAAGERREVWLRSNLRPVAAAVAVAAGLAILAIIAVLTLHLPGWATVIVATLAGGDALAAAVLAWGAAQPRLALDGDAVAVRLAPLTVHRVPLGVVECIFRGSEPIAAEGDSPKFRVGTLVLRLAERATEWRQRPSFRPWGTWEDGHVVIDGRWCEPLSPESARQIAARLADAKRAPVSECPS